jgi:hypothetical protein
VAAHGRLMHCSRVAGIERLRHGRRQASAPAADVSRRMGWLPPVGDIGIRSAWSAKSLAYLKRAESPNNLAVTSGGHGGIGRRSGLKIPSAPLHPCKLPPAQRFWVCLLGVAGVERKSACLLRLRGGVCFADKSAAMRMRELMSAKMPLMHAAGHPIRGGSSQGCNRCTGGVQWAGRRQIN